MYECIKQCPSCGGDTAIVIEDDRVHAECLMCGMRSADVTFETHGLGRWTSRHKDIRLMFQTFRKQNVNFLEILFTPYKKLSPYYTDLWSQLTTPENREMIAHYNPVQAVRTMCGMCSEKLHALEHLYPSKVDVIERYGYDPKQLHHIIRMTEYIKRYIAGEPYEACLRSRQPIHLRDIKLKPLPLAEARALATTQYQLAKQMYEQYRDSQSERVNPDVDVLLNRTQSDIVRRYLMIAWGNYSEVTL